VREIISIRLTCAGAQGQRGRKEEKSQEVYFFWLEFAYRGHNVGGFGAK